MNIRFWRNCLHILTMDSMTGATSGQTTFVTRDFCIGHISQILFFFPQCRVNLMSKSIPPPPVYEMVHALLFWLSLYLDLFFWPLCCLFFDLLILITPLVSTNSSYSRNASCALHLKYTFLFSHIVGSNLYMYLYFNVLFVWTDINYFSILSIAYSSPKLLKWY
jgi:hypothetical protein